MLNINKNLVDDLLETLRENEYTRKIVVKSDLFDITITNFGCIEMDIDNLTRQFDINVEYDYIITMYDNIIYVKIVLPELITRIENVIVKNVDINRDFLINIKCPEIDMNECFVHLYRINPVLDIETMIFDDIRDAFREYRINPTQYDFTWEYDMQNGLWDGTPCQKLTFVLRKIENVSRETSANGIVFYDDERNAHYISANTLLSTHDWVMSIMDNFDLSELDIVYVIHNGKIVYINRTLNKYVNDTNGEIVKTVVCQNFEYTIVS